MIYVCNDDMRVVGDGMPLRLHEWAVYIKISPPVSRRMAQTTKKECIMMQR